MNIIEIENLSCRFADGTLALDRINVSIPKGTLVVIAGCNGSGKTTLLRHLNGLLLPEQGRVTIAGVSVSRDVQRARRLVGMVFQDPDSQIVGETVAMDVAFGPENLRLDAAETNKRVAAALATVGLTELADQPPHLLSGGEKRRLAIAGILAMQPKIVAFDEPFASLDYPGTRQVLQEIIKLKQNGHTILITTHDLEKIVFYADHLIILQHGAIVREGLPEQILRDVEAFGVRQPCASRLGMEAESWLN
jgi:biotin transport system ATP-binding protein